MPDSRVGAACVNTVPVRISARPLSIADIVDVARHGAAVRIDDDAIDVVERGRERVELLLESAEPVYGISTGFGALAQRMIAPQKRELLQASVVRSHAAGMGEPVEREVVRAMMVVRARTLLSGYCGVRPLLVEGLVGLLNNGISPIVPEHGSLGCSGDLAPLAHVGLALMGEGTVDVGGVVLEAAAALGAAGMAPVRLAAKEGLSLINGTDGMLGMLALACHDGAQLLRLADVAAALSVEALLGTDRPFADDLQSLRPHPGQAVSAANLRRVLEGSAIVASHRTGDSRVQDAYSLRCHPQVAGAARDTLTFTEDIAGRELASAIDNPVVMEDGRIESCGNFHGAPLAFACDFLAIALAEVGAIAERRVDRLLDPARSHGLPPFLAHDPGVDSGLMIAQYTAAAMAAENRRLAAPASVDSLPTSAMQEDHVSMGWGAARKLRVILRNVRRIVAVEILTATRALELRAPLEPAPASRAVCEAVREVVGGAGPDAYMAPQLAAVDELLVDGRLLAAAERAIGELA